MAETINCGIIALAAALILGGCAKNHDEQTDIPDAPPAETTVKDVRFVLPEIPYVGEPDAETETKVGFDLASGGGFQLSWAATDTLGVCPDTGSQIYFVVNDPTSQTVTFDGGGWALKNSSTYRSYLPFVGDIYLDPERVPVSFDGQFQDGSGAPQASVKAFLASTGTLENESMVFHFNCMNCYIRVTATLPAGTYRRMILQTEDPLFVEKGIVDLTAASHVITGTKYSRMIYVDLDNFTLASDGTLVAFIASAPVNLNGVQVSVFFVDDSGIAYRCLKTPSRAYEANMLYGLTCSSFSVADGFNFGITGWGSGGSYSGTAH